MMERNTPDSHCDSAPSGVMKVLWTTTISLRGISQEQGGFITIRDCSILDILKRAMLTDDDKQWISQQLEKVETKLLTEFHKWATPVEMRQRSHSAALRAMDIEMESLSDRVKNLEGPAV